MVQEAAEPTGPLDAHEVILIPAVGDERTRVAAGTARFDAAIAKSDMLLDDDSPASAERIMENALAEEARLTIARADLEAIIGALAAYGATVHGARAPQAAAAGIGRSEDDDAIEKKELRMLKRKLPSPKDGWKDTKGVIHRAHVDMNLMFR
jgi:hypothetical protein